MSAYEKLTAKQQRFVDEYMVDMNGTQAYKRAGYQAKTDKVASVSAVRLLANDRIQDAIQERRKAQAERTEITADYVLKSLKTVAERCMQGEEVMVYDKALEDYVGTGEWKFDSSGANKSLELLGKHLKLFTDKVEQENSGEVTVKFNIPRPTYKKGDGS